MLIQCATWCPLTVIREADRGETMPTVAFPQLAGVGKHSPLPVQSEDVEAQSCYLLTITSWYMYRTVLSKGSWIQIKDGAIKDRGGGSDSKHKSYLLRSNQGNITSNVISNQPRHV